MRDFRELIVWEKGHELTLDTYRATGGFPKHELYGLVSQMRRSAASVPTNFAEGCGRHGNNELARFMQISMGSASELQYQFLLAHDLGYLEKQAYTNLNFKVIELKKMLSKFIKSLRNRPS